MRVQTPRGASIVTPSNSARNNEISHATATIWACPNLAQIPRRATVCGTATSSHAALLPLPFVAALFCLSPHYIPEDPHAFPKYRVTFLNGLPVLNQTADSWLQGGLKGGEREFLEQPLDDDQWQANPFRKGIGSGDDLQQDSLSEPPAH